MWTLLFSCLIHSYFLFLNIPTIFRPKKVLSFNSAQISWLLIGCLGFCIRHSIGFILHVSGYKLKIKFILRLIKRGDRAMISLFTILKVSAQDLLTIGKEEPCCSLVIPKDRFKAMVLIYE